jgi:hypothetical protein
MITFHACARVSIHYEVVIILGVSEWIRSCLSRGCSALHAAPAIHYFRNRYRLLCHVHRLVYVADILAGSNARVCQLALSPA